MIKLRALTLSIAGVLALGPFAALAQTSVAPLTNGLRSDVTGTTIPAAEPNLGAATRDQLSRTSDALRITGKATVLAIGSSSTAGVGASSPAHTYEARLEVNLENSLEGTDFRVIGRGLSGEVAEGAAARMKREIDDVNPDLVIWQVGTNDALRHVAMEDFKRCLTKTLAWLKAQKVDVILLNPQYGELLVKDNYYEKVIAAISDVALQANVLLVDRFAAMRKLRTDNASTRILSADNLHMNDEGYERLSVQLARSIIGAMPTGAGKTIARNSTAK